MEQFGHHEWLEPEEFPVWRRRLEAERYVGNLTPHRRDALRALLSFYGHEGLWPSDAAVAQMACVSVSTVRRARQDARALGMLTWVHTRRNGRQGTNLYTVRVPTTLVCARPDVQAERRRIGSKKKEAREVATPTWSGEPSDARDALARVRERFLARQVPVTIPNRPG